MSDKKRLLAGVAVALGLATVPRGASAQVEVPVFIEDSGDTADSGDEGNPDEFVIQSAAKRVETVFESSQIVTVFTAEQLRASGFLTLDDVLNAVPGFEARRSRQFYREGPRTWGRGAGRVILYLINGIPINLAKVDAPDGVEIPLTGVKRIEIVSGPGGVVWGANAYLGVVNMIVEPSLGDNKAELGLFGAGGDGMQKGFVGTVAAADSWMDGKIRAAAWFRYYTSQDNAITMPYDIIDGPSSDPSPPGAFEFAPSSGPTVNERDQLGHLRLAADVFGLKVDLLYPLITENHSELTARGVRVDHYRCQPGDEQDLMGCTPGKILPFMSTDYDSTATVLSLRYTFRLGEDSSLDARAYYSGYRQVETDSVLYGIQPDKPVGQHDYDYYSDSLGPEGDMQYAAGGGLDYKWDTKRNTLLAGGEAFVDGNRTLEFSLSGVINDPHRLSIPKDQRTTVAAYFDDRLRLGKIELDGGARVQYNQDYGTVYLGSAFGLWRIQDNIFLKVGWAMGIRPPVTKEQNRITDPKINPYPQIRGNHDLKAEKSQSAETEISGLFLRNVPGIRYLRLALGYQHTRLDDLILERDGAITNSTGRNIESIESRAELKVGQSKVGLGYHWIYAVDDEFGEVRNMANNKLILSLDAPLTSWCRLYVSVTTYGAREDLNRKPLCSTGNCASDPATNRIQYDAPASSVVVDRLAPATLVHASLTFHGLWDDRLDFQITAFNATNLSYGTPDEDFEARQAALSVPGPLFSILAGMTLRI